MFISEKVNSHVDFLRFRTARRPVRHAWHIAIGITSPVVAAEKTAKPVKVTMPASAVKDPASKLCMPQTITGAKRDKSLPATMCLTRDEWAAQGVTIVVKS